VQHTAIFVEIYSLRSKRCSTPKLLFDSKAD
jgi:hypothetical protein